MSWCCIVSRENGPLMLSIEMSSNPHSKEIREAMERLSRLRLTWTFSKDHAAQEMLSWIVLQGVEQYLQQLTNSDSEPPPSKSTPPTMGSA